MTHKIDGKGIHSMKRSRGGRDSGRFQGRCGNKAEALGWIQRGRQSTSGHFRWDRYRRVKKSGSTLIQQLRREGKEPEQGQKDHYDAAGGRRSSGKGLAAVSAPLALPLGAEKQFFVYRTATRHRAWSIPTPRPSSAGTAAK